MTPKEAIEILNNIITVNRRLVTGLNKAEANHIAELIKTQAEEKNQLEILVALALAELKVKWS